MSTSSGSGQFLRPPPLLSVVITCFNVGTLLRKAVDSVVSQLTQDLPSEQWELIVVDDASSDPATQAVLLSLQKDSSAPRLLFQSRNSGVSAARNAGANAATGEWLAFLDGDDCWAPGRFEILQTALTKYSDSSWISADYRRIGMDGEYLGTSFIRHPSIASILNTDQDICTRLKRPIEAALSSFLCHTNSTIIRRRCFTNANGFDESLRTAEDHDLWIRLSVQNDLVYVPRCASLYRVNPNSITNTTRKPHPDLGAVYRKALKAPGTRLYSELILKRIEIIALENLLYLRRRRQFGEAVREALSLLKTSPGYRPAWKHLLAATLRIG